MSRFQKTELLNSLSAFHNPITRTPSPNGSTITSGIFLWNCKKLVKYCFAPSIRKVKNLFRLIKKSVLKKQNRCPHFFAFGRRSIEYALHLCQTHDIFVANCSGNVSLVISKFCCAAAQYMLNDTLDVPILSAKQVSYLTAVLQKSIRLISRSRIEPPGLFASCFKKYSEHLKIWQSVQSINGCVTFPNWPVAAVLNR